MRNARLEQEVQDLRLERDVAIRRLRAGQWEPLLEAYPAYLDTLQTREATI